MSEETTAQTQESSEPIKNQPAGDSFEAITTQEQFDKAIKSRLAREKQSTRKAVEEEYAEALEKAKQFDELQEKNKSELEKAVERGNKLESELKAIKHEREVAKWAQEAAKKTGVDVSLIRGETQEEMLEHAESIKELMGSKYTPTPSSGKPANATQIDSDEEETARLRRAAGLDRKG